MRISDWSSDVCSSDLPARSLASALGHCPRPGHHHKRAPGARVAVPAAKTAALGGAGALDCGAMAAAQPAVRQLGAAALAATMPGRPQPPPGSGLRDRTSVVEGKSVSVRVDLGGRRIIKKKK